MAHREKRVPLGLRELFTWRGRSYWIAKMGGRVKKMGQLIARRCEESC